MISDFDDFCLWTYSIVDDLWVGLAPLFKRPGPEPLCSDSELLTLAVVGECRGWDLETELLSSWQEHRDLFPILPSQSRFNRRRRHLRDAFNLVRRAIVSLVDVAQERRCVIDSLPVPVISFHLVPSSPGAATWKSAGAAFGKVPTKKQTIFGYKLHLLLTAGGVILDFELAPANAADLTVGSELLAEHRDLDVTGDKGYRSEPVATALREERGIILRTLPRSNETKQVPAPTRLLLNHIRQIVETVNGQLADQFHLEINHAHTFEGLCTRLMTKLAAHTLSIYLNRLLGNPNWLQIKALAFPN
jgi:Transposase DDE domain